MKDGTSQIYSIRDYGDENTEFKPHATIEYSGGKVKQIKGYKDSLIDLDCMEATRQLVMSLIHADSLEDIIASEIPSSEKTNMGLLFDPTGACVDLLNVNSQNAQNVRIPRLVIKSSRLKHFPLKKLKIDKLCLQGINSKALEFLSKSSITDIVFSGTFEVDHLDFSDLQCHRLSLEPKGECPLKEIILPPSCSKLYLKGTFSQLSKVEGKTVEEMQADGEFQKLKALPENVDKLTLTGKFEALSSLLQSNVSNLFLSGKLDQLRLLPENVEDLALTISSASPIENFSKLKKLKSLKVSADQLDLDDLLDIPTLKFCELLSISSDVERIDLLSHHARLEKLALDSSTYPNLKEIILSEGTQLNMSHSQFPALERIDLSRSLLKTFGVFEIKGHHFLHLDDPDGVIPEGYAPKIPIYTGNMTSFSVMPQIKEIKLRKDIEQIDLLGMHFGEHMPINFSEYPDLESLKFRHVDISSDVKIDLSGNQKLKEVVLPVHMLSQIKLPEAVETLELLQEKDKPIPENLNLRDLKNLKKLETNFLVNPQVLQSSLESLKISWPNGKYNDVKELDFSSLKNLEINSNVILSTAPNLERIVMAENFLTMTVEKVCPCLKELDFTHTKIVHLQELPSQLCWNNSGYDEFKSRSLHSVLTLHPEQFRVLNKIKVGKDTEITLPQSAQESPVTLELACDVSKEKEEQLRAAYPALNITRQPFALNRLLPPFMQDRAAARG